MPPIAQLFASSLAPNSVLSLCVPSHLAPETSSDAIRVKQFDFGPFEGQEKVVGMVRMMAIGKGKARAMDDDSGNSRMNTDAPEEQESHRDWLAVADSLNFITLSRIPPSPTTQDFSEDSPRSRTLRIEARYKVEGVRKADRWIGLEVLECGVLSTLSSGLVTLHPFPSPSSPSSSTSPSTSTTRTARLPSPLTCLQNIPDLPSNATLFGASSSGNTSRPIFVAAAGKEVDLGIWNLAQLFASGSSTAAASQFSDGKGGKGGKRKKGELEEGQIWVAKNLPNNSLSLRTPIHHLSLSILPTTSPSPDALSQSTELAPGLAHLRIVTGTQNGHIRLYSTSQRKPLFSYKMGTEGGIGVVHPGQAEHEAFYAEGSALFGAMDLRTGRTLYKYAVGSTSTAQALLTLPAAPSSMFSNGHPAKKATRSKSDKQEVALVSIGSDATMRICSTGGVPKETKDNVLKGEVLATVGAVGVGRVVFGGWHDVIKETDHDAEVQESGGDDEDRGAEDIWDDLKVVQGDEADSTDEEDETDGEEEDFRVKRRKQEGRS